jgi:hypothetical protein
MLPYVIAYADARLRYRFMYMFAHAIADIAMFTVRADVATASRCASPSLSHVNRHIDYITITLHKSIYPFMLSVISVIYPANNHVKMEGGYSTIEPSYLLTSELLA